MFNIRSLALSAVVAAVSSNTAFAQRPHTGIVDITVEESMGMVSGLLIRATGQSTRTDSAGHARLTLPAGSQTLSITQLGYKPTRVPVVVVADSVTRVTVTVEMTGMEMEAIRRDADGATH